MTARCSANRSRGVLLAAALASLLLTTCGPAAGEPRASGAARGAATQSTPPIVGVAGEATAPPRPAATTDQPTPQPTAPPSPAVDSPTGYSRLSVPTAAGVFRTYLIKERLTDVRVRTVTATLTECFSACSAKPLAQYVVENGAYAGIHGSYFCPPDYPPCTSKVNTYDYAVYNSTLGAWLNPRHLVNPRNALAVWNDNTPTFYRRVSSYGRSPVTAGISNFPLLLQGGALTDVSRLDPSQMLRASRGAIAVDSTFVYLAIAESASVPEIALVLQALGARDALNLDGGSSDAMWIGGAYVVGPGRQLPNAILLVKP
jgi:hypothetical protein